MSRKLSQCILVPAIFLAAAHFSSAAPQAGEQPPPKPDLKKLLADLKSPDDQTKFSAIMALADFGPEAAPAIGDLISAITNGSEDFRLNAAIALGKIGKAAVAPLSELINSKNEDSRYYAISALGWIGPDAQATAGEIVKALADKSDGVRRKAAFALGRIAPKAEVALPVLIAAFGDANEDVRAAAAEAVGQFGAAAVPVLIETMNEKKAPKSVFAARAVAAIGAKAEPAIPTLKGWLHSNDGPWREEAGEALAKIGKPAIEVLVNATTSDQKDTRITAVHSLNKIGPEAVPDLVDALGSKHVDVRRAAAEALMPQRISDKMVVLGLAYALKDEDEHVRLLCAQGLQQLGLMGKLAAPKLREALIDINSEVRFAAYYALNGMNEDPRATLRKHLEDKTASTRINAAALLMMTTGDKDAVPVLREALNEKDLDLRMQAAFALVQRGQNAAETTPIFMDGLKSKSAGVRNQAIQGLMRLGPKAAVAAPTLLDILQNDPDPNTKQQAMFALQNVGGDPKVILPALKKMIVDDSPAVRMAAVQVVWRYGGEAIPLLVARLDDKDANVAQNATWMLHNVQADKTALPHIRPLLKHKNSNVRTAAVQLLSRCGDDAVDDLIACLKDDDSNVRWQAFHGLRGMQGSAKKLLPLLTDMVKDAKGDSTQRGFAVQALGQLGPEGFPTLFDILKTEKDENVRGNAIANIGNYGAKSKEALPILIEALSDKSSTVRWRAASALSNMGQFAKPAIPNLIDALKDDDQNVRNHAMWALQNQGKEPLGPLTKTLETGNSNSRQMALQIFQNHNYRDKSLVPGLIACLKDKAPNVQIQACQRLAAIGQDAKVAVAPLRELVSNVNSGVANAAQNALNAIEPKKK